MEARCCWRPGGRRRRTRRALRWLWRWQRVARRLWGPGSGEAGRRSCRGRALRVAGCCCFSGGAAARAAWALQARPASCVARAPSNEWVAARVWRAAWGPAAGGVCTHLCMRLAASLRCRGDSCCCGRSAGANGCSVGAVDAAQRTTCLAAAWRRWRIGRSRMVMMVRPAGAAQAHSAAAALSALLSPGLRFFRVAKTVAGRCPFAQRR